MDKIELKESQLVALFEIAVSSGQEMPDVSDHPALLRAAECGYSPTVKIGEGGMAEVWRAIDSNTGRDVAIKVAHVDSEPAQALLEREAETLSELQPPSVAALIRKGGEGPTRFLILEFIHGISLSDHVRQAPGSGPTLDAALQAMIRVCQAVEHVHHAGFLHGDLKPSNVLIRPDGSAVLIDFGLSVRVGHQDTPVLARSYRGGTDLYTPPELKGGTALVRETCGDVYSLGVMFQQVLDELALEPTLAPPPSPSPPEVKEVNAVRSILSKATAEDPSQRYGSALDIMAALSSQRDAIADRAGRSRLRPVFSAAAIAITLAVIFGLLSSKPWWNAGPVDARTNSGVVLAAAMLAQGETEDAARELRDVKEADRGWEWRHLWTAATSPPAVIELRFPKPGLSSAIGSGCDAFAVGTLSGDVRLYRADGSSQVLLPADRGVTHLATDGRAFLATFSGGAVWRIPEDGGPAKGGQGPLNRVSVCWPLGQDHPDQVALYQLGEAVTLDLNTLQVTGRRPARLALPASSNPGWALLGREDEADRMHIEIIHGALGERGVVEDVLTDGEFPLCMDVDAGASRAVVGTSAGRVLLYDLSEGGGGDAPARVERTVSAGEAVTAVVVDTAENRLFAASDGMLHVMELDTGRTLLSLPFPIRGVARNIRWDPASGTLALGTDIGGVIWKAPPNAGSVALR